MSGGQAFEDGGAKQQWGAFTDEEGRIRRDAFSAAAGGVNQRVWALINKGKVWRELLTQPTMRAVVGHVLGRCLSAIKLWRQHRQAGRHRHEPAYRPVVDAGADTSPTQPGAGRGRLTRELSNRVDEFPAMIAPPVVVNVMWMLNDFTEANGATRLAPRSHLYGRRPGRRAGQGSGPVSRRRAWPAAP